MTKIMNSLLSFFKKLTIGKKILLLLTPVITLISDMKVAIFALAFLVVLDLLTGIRKTHHKNDVPFNPFKKLFWKNIKSYLLRQTWKKTYEYIFGILAVAVFEIYLLGTTQVEALGKSNSFTEWAIIIAGSIELWSVFENMEDVSGNNFLKRLMNILPENIRKLFSKKKDSVEE